MSDQPAGKQRARVHIVAVLESPLRAMCGNPYALRFESDNMRRVTCRTCRRLAMKVKRP